MSSPVPPSDRPWALDVHAHFNVPDDSLLDQAAKEGKYAGPTTAWTPEGAMTFMDARHIQMQLLSFPMQLPAETARRYNDFAAAVVAAHPDRFGMLANIPLGDPDPEAALREIDRAAGELNADGFALVTNYEGKYLGDPSFEPVFAALNQRQANVHIHPVNPAGFCSATPTSRGSSPTAAARCPCSPSRMELFLSVVPIEGVRPARTRPSQSRTRSAACGSTWPAPPSLIRSPP